MGEKEGEKGGGKKSDGVITVVLKIDMHCEGCADKVRKTVKSIGGVEGVKTVFDANKLTVVGKVDPMKLREKLEQKTKKKVELISPLPKKGQDGGGGETKKTDDKGEKKGDGEAKKPKEPPVVTVALKMRLHCVGCIQKIYKTVSKTKGVQEVSIDREKDLVTVKGTMDVKELMETLSEKFKRPVEIVQPKKDGGGGEGKKEKKGGGDGGGGEGKKEKKGGGDGGDGGGGGNEKTSGGGGKKEEAGKAEGMRMEYMGMGYGYGPPPGSEYGFGYMYPPGYTVQQLHAPQIFSDENPNACSIM